MESTAGAYLGKYLSATFGSLLDATDSCEGPDDNQESFTVKAARWKLTLYWTTNRRFWFSSKPITECMEPTECLQNPDVRKIVRWCAIDSIKIKSDPEIQRELARRQWDSLNAAIERVISNVEQPQVDSFCLQRLRFNTLLITWVHIPVGIFQIPFATKQFKIQYRFHN